MQQVIKGLVLVAGLATAGLAQAGWYENGTEYDYARVVAVDPIYDTYQRPIARNQCWNERVDHGPRYASGGYYGPRGNDAAGTLLGAIVGGALGNQVGRGDGRRAATIAGAVIGGAIGNNVADGRGWHGGGHYGYDHGHRGGQYASSVRQVCDQRVSYRTERRVVAYDVTYVYNGRTFRTQMNDYPGERIRVAVSVNAVGY